jgi:hypothetical protein
VNSHLHIPHFPSSKSGEQRKTKRSVSETWSASHSPAAVLLNELIDNSGLGCIEPCNGLHAGATCGPGRRGVDEEGQGATKT